MFNIMPDGSFMADDFLLLNKTSLDKLFFFFTYTLAEIPFVQIEFMVFLLLIQW